MGEIEGKLAVIESIKADYEEQYRKEMERAEDNVFEKTIAKRNLDVHMAEIVEMKKALLK